MSCNLGVPMIKKIRASVAKELLATNAAPQSIKDYVAAGIDGLVARYGEDVEVTVTGSGHLCDGPSSYDITSATIGVRKE